MTFTWKLPQQGWDQKVEGCIDSLGQSGCTAAVTKARMAARICSDSNGQALTTLANSGAVETLPGTSETAFFPAAGLCCGLCGLDSLGFPWRFPNVAADCKSAIPGSNPGGASAFPPGINVSPTKRFQTLVLYPHGPCYTDRSRAGLTVAGQANNK
jgi:hypothetical protein